MNRRKELIGLRNKGNRKKFKEKRGRNLRSAMRMLRNVWKDIQIKRIVKK